MRASIVLPIALTALALSGVGRAQSTATATPAPVAPAAASAGLPEWMAGCWSQPGASTLVEECWMAPRAGVMLGAGRTSKHGKLIEWEATQIMPGPDGKLVYWASPDGGTRVAFTELSRGPTEIVFANPAHDYPQRIRYWREGEQLGAEISLLDGSKFIVWKYKRDQ